MLASGKTGLGWKVRRKTELPVGTPEIPALVVHIQDAIVMSGGPGLKASPTRPERKNSMYTIHTSLKSETYHAPE
jgi:hypothetical protein